MVYYFLVIIKVFFRLQILIIKSTYDFVNLIFSISIKLFKQRKNNDETKCVSNKKFFNDLDDIINEEFETIINQQHHGKELKKTPISLEKKNKSGSNNKNKDTIIAGISRFSFLIGSFLCLTLFIIYRINYRTIYISDNDYTLQSIEAAEQESLDTVNDQDSDSYHTKRNLNDHPNLSSMLNSFNINHQDIFIYLKEINKFIPLNKLNPSVNFDFDYTCKNNYYDCHLRNNIPWCKKQKLCNLDKISFKNNGNLITIQKNTNGTLNSSTKQIKLIDRYIYKQGVVTNSLYGDMMNIGISPTVIQKVITQAMQLIDFQRDIKSGNEFQILYKEVFNEYGESEKNYKLLFFGFNLGRDNYKFYEFNNGFYDKDGVNIRKELLRTPIDGARISSHFGNRKHPVLGYTRAHKGIDFAAPTGTRIYASGDATVTFIGRKNGYGNFISLKHNATYSTQYAHMSGFSKSIKNGSKVKQGQVIGYVGSTGLASGPHLHYEILINGKHTNPLSVKFSSSGKLSKTEMTYFDERKREIINAISRYSNDN